MGYLISAWMETSIWLPTNSSYRRPWKRALGMQKYGLRGLIEVFTTRPFREYGRCAFSMENCCREEARKMGEKAVYF